MQTLPRYLDLLLPFQESGSVPFAHYIIYLQYMIDFESLNHLIFVITKFSLVILITFLHERVLIKPQNMQPSFILSSGLCFLDSQSLNEVNPIGSFECIYTLHVGMLNIIITHFQVQTSKKSKCHFHRKLNYYF